jgi:hypothetical protein
MKVFLSYRRDDTGGRSGRLFDSLADAIGTRNVFQDVATLAPGRDFADQVAAAIAASDAVLVVIGPGWFGAAVGQPGRRLDRPDDPVRQEVAQALASGIPVVPVLVDGATLPGEAELPSDLVALTRRQAVTLSDDSWRADVVELLRRLKGEPPAGGRRRRAVAVGVGVGALVLGGIVITAAVRDDGGGSWEPPPPCAVDDTWDERTLVEDPTAEMTEGPWRIGFAVRRSLSRSAAPGDVDVVVEVAATDLTPPEAVDPSEPEAPYFGSDWIDGLVVDGVLTSDIACWGPIAGDQQLEPGRTAIVTMGFDSSVDPTGVPLALDVASDTDGAVVPVG